VANVSLAILLLDELFKQLCHLGRHPARRPLVSLGMAEETATARSRSTPGPHSGTGSDIWGGGS
jgi:hypothetical protein